jgi:glycosyltransferase involved in cell wall biosynthesis
MAESPQASGAVLGPERVCPEAINRLIDEATYVGKVFLLAREMESRLRAEIDAYLRAVGPVTADYYPSRFIACLRQYLDSDLVFQDIEQVRKYARTLEVGQEVPWFLGLMQSLWHLRHDSVSRAVARPFQTGVAVLVPVFNETRFTELCLKSIRGLGGLPHHIVVVNNSSADVTDFRQAVLRDGLADDWFDSGSTWHGEGLQLALPHVGDQRYIATIDSDAVGLRENWLRDLVQELERRQAAVAGPARLEGARDIIGHVIHPCCLVIDRARIGSRFEIDFRSQWPFWDVAGLLTWDCLAHGLPIVKVSSEHNGPCALGSTLVNGAVRHYWYVSRITTLQDDEELDGYRVGDIRARLDRDYESPELDALRSLKVGGLGGPCPGTAETSQGVQEAQRPSSTGYDGEAGAIGSTNLDALAKASGTDKSSLCHNYTRYYDRYFASIRQRPLKLLEIGVEKGRSIRTWEEFFPNAEIFGIDVDPACRQYGSERTRIFIGDQADERFLRSVAQTAGGSFDIIIDDGGHFMHQQKASFKVLFEYVAPGGIYVIEDLHTSYWERYGGGIGKPDTTMAFLKDLLDEVNHHGGQGVSRPAGDSSPGPAAETGRYVRDIETIHFFTSICFILKKARAEVIGCSEDAHAAGTGAPSRGARAISVVVTTYNRPKLLVQVLEGFAAQTVGQEDFEVVVVDDGSLPPVREITDQFADRMRLKYLRQENAGLAAARNAGIRAAEGVIVLFSDDDDVPALELVAEHLRSHREYPDERVAVLGHLDWHPDLEVTPLMQYVTHVGGEYFGFDRLQDGQFYDRWKWWGGLVSAKRSLLQSVEGPFDTRLRFGYEDTELACRLADRQIRVLYNARARSYVLKPMTFEEFCRRSYKQGKALHRVAAAHPEVIVARYHLEDAADEYWGKYAEHLEEWGQKVAQFETFLTAERRTPGSVTDRHLQTLYAGYRECFRGYVLKGYVEQLEAAERGEVSLSQPVNGEGPSSMPDSADTINSRRSQSALRRRRVPCGPDKPDLPPTGTVRPLHIAFVDTNTPCFDVGSSCLRIHHIARILTAQGHRIDYLYTNHHKADKRYKAIYEGAVKFIKVAPTVNSFRDYLHFNEVADLDLVWITNLWALDYTDFALQLVLWLRENRPQVKIIIDTMDLHYKKFMRRFELSRAPQDHETAERFLALERRLYPLADQVLAVTEVEKGDIQAHAGACAVAVVPNIHEVLPEGPPIHERRHLCFLGAFRIRHNLDAVQWFLQQVHPLLLQRAPETQLHILGYGNEEFREAFATYPNVKVVGYVENAERAVAQYRLFVCPMIYGAGMKGKLGVAAAAGTPFVTTTIGAEGFGFVDGRHCFIADEPPQFADRCMQLMRDDGLWQRFHDQSRELLAREFSVEAVARRLAHLLETCTRRGMEPPIPARQRSAATLCHV